MSLFNYKIDIDEELRYRNYIHNHINNIKKAFDKNKEYIKTIIPDEYLMGELYKNVLKHDSSKFSVEEFNGYRQWFNTKPGEVKDKELFDYAWLHHIHYNTHHWNHWVLIDKNNDMIVLNMPIIYIVEMLLDWTAMGYHFNDTAESWYYKNKEDIILSDKTRETVEEIIGNFK